MVNNYLFLPAFIVFWCLINYLLSILSGWSGAAKVYRNSCQEADESWHFRSAKINLVDYGSCLSFGKNDYGIFIKVMFIFSLGSPTLFIPWEDLIIEDYKILFISCKLLKFKKFDGMKVRIGKSLAKKLIKE